MVFWETLLPADVFTSGVAKCRQAQISPKFPMPSNFPKIPKIMASTAAWGHGILRKFDPCRCFRIRGDENAARLKFPRKRWQGSSFPQIPEILASMGSAGP